jgi:hypothetical protein
MIDYVELGRCAAQQKRVQEQTRLDQQRAANDQLLNEFLTQHSSGLTRALAALFEADPTAPEFAGLTWDFPNRAALSASRSSGGVVVNTTSTDRGLRDLRTRFQGVDIAARGWGESVNFRVVTASGSTGFKDLAGFGEALDQFKRSRDW